MKGGGEVGGEVIRAGPQRADKRVDPPQTSKGRATTAATARPGLALPAYTRDPARSGGSMPATPTPKTLMR